MIVIMKEQIVFRICALKSCHIMHGCHVYGKVSNDVIGDPVVGVV